MIERYTGTVNIVDSRFESNFSQTYGAAIYTRGNTLNVIDTYFGDNIASGWVRRQAHLLNVVKYVHLIVASNESLYEPFPSSHNREEQYFVRLMLL